MGHIFFAFVSIHMPVKQLIGPEHRKQSLFHVSNNVWQPSKQTSLSSKHVQTFKLMQATDFI